MALRDPGPVQPLRQSGPIDHADLVEAAPATRPPRFGPQLVPAVGLAAVALFLAGVVGTALHGGSGSYPKGQPAEVVTAAAATLQQAPSLRFSLSTEFKAGGLPGGAKDIVFKETGSIDRASGAGALLLSGPPDVLAQPVQIVTTRDAVYVKVPDSKRASAGGKAWLAVSASQLGGGLRSVPVAPDPTQLLSVLRSLATSVRQVGREDVRGTATTRYAADLDLRKAAGSTPFRGLLAGVPGGTSLPPLHLDVWIDGRRFPRQLVETFDFQGLVSLRMELDLTDSSDPAPVVVPPASDVAPGTSDDIARLLKP